MTALAATYDSMIADLLDLDPRDFSLPQRTPQAVAPRVLRPLTMPEFLQPKPQPTKAAPITAAPVASVPVPSADDDLEGLVLDDADDDDDRTTFWDRFEAVSMVALNAGLVVLTLVLMVGVGTLALAAAAQRGMVPADLSPLTLDQATAIPDAVAALVGQAFDATSTTVSAVVRDPSSLVSFLRS